MIEEGARSQYPVDALYGGTVADLRSSILAVNTRTDTTNAAFHLAFRGQALEPDSALLSSFGIGDMNVSSSITDPRRCRIIYLNPTPFDLTVVDSFGGTWTISIDASCSVDQVWSPCSDRFRIRVLVSVATACSFSTESATRRTYPRR